MGVWQDRGVTIDPEPRAALTRVRLDLAYDGTEFSGWAAQPGLRTVQGELEEAIAVLLRTGAGARVRLTVGGRTDAGVHARGQVAHLDVTHEQLAKWSARRGPDARRDAAAESATRARKLNGVLQRGAPDIAIHSARIVPAAFDARFSALRRRYEYRLRGEGMRRDPLTARFTAEVPKPLDLAAMQRASDELLGLNDFTTFCKAREGATAVRDLLCFEWRETEDAAYAARIEADAFCHSMVRALVGAIVAVGSGRIGEDELLALRDARERSSRFTVMPAHGLSLEEIAYPADDELALRAEQTRARRDPLDAG
ncbi:tRNA pseudouridine(38-40) synthase TruA [Leucobacter muris]|uniref:tRNA pseudouridine synthase A n=1 Tax=Leucobacter muris TaxID=1935379 RepID=A0ABX5QDY9_9MICO|nr:tRNA pseudouridine(38-40) synthase TruA [Leucobacter muris]